jgi:hypothetical protein
VTDHQKQKQKAFLQRFPLLPDDAAVPLLGASWLTGISDRTWRYSPPIPTFYITPNKRGVNVGMLRKLMRGESENAS